MRPQIGARHNWGRWTAELTAQIWFYTGNNDFFNGLQLEQAPLGTLDANLIYTFRPGLWAAASVGYAGGGTTTVNGASNDDRQSNLGFGFSVGLPLSRAVGVKLYYLGGRTEVHTGQNSDTFACALSAMW